MSVETGQKQSEVSEEGRKIRALSQLEDLERQGIHIDSIAKAIDTTPGDVLSEEITRVHSGEQQEIEHALEHEPTFAQRNRVITRKQSRRTASNLLRRR